MSMLIAGVLGVVAGLGGTAGIFMYMDRRRERQHREAHRAPFPGPNPSTPKPFSAGGGQA